MPCASIVFIVFQLKKLLKSSIVSIPSNSCHDSEHLSVLSVPIHKVNKRDNELRRISDALSDPVEL